MRFVPQYCTTAPPDVCVITQQFSCKSTVLPLDGSIHPRFKNAVKLKVLLKIIKFSWIKRV